jgi:hypothetical protein
MSWSKEDIIFKKLSSKRVTWTSNQVFEEIGARSLDIHNTDIKADPIPDTPPGTSTSVLQFYDYGSGTGLTLVKDLTVSDNLTYFATIFNGSGQEAFANQLVGAGATGRLFNFVSDKYDALGTAAGAGYEIKLYDKDGVQITKTDSSLWYFDYQTGILMFQNSAAGTIASRAPFSITAYRYIGGFGITAGTGGSGSGTVGTGYTTGIAYYTGANDITSSSSFTWDNSSSTLTLLNGSFSLSGSTITAGTWAGNAISTLYGGTGLTSYTKGDLLVGLGGTLIKLPVGTNNYFLTADSSTDSGLNWVSGLATTGIISINNLDSVAQTLEVGSAGVKFGIVSTGSSHTFNLPDAGIGVTGLITGKAQTIAGVKSFTDNLILDSASEIRFYDSTSSNYIGLVAGSPSTNFTLTLPDADGTAGQVLKTDGAGTLSWVDKSVSVGQVPPGSPQQGDLWWSTLEANLYIYYNDGTSAQWVEATTGANGGNYGGSGSGISSLNGLTFPDQTFAVSSLGSDFTISSAGSSHTFNLPDASASARGLISTSTQSLAGLKRFLNGLEIKSGNSLKLYNSADTAYTAFNSVATSSVTYSLPATDGTALQVIYTDGSAGLGWTHVGDVYIDVDPPVTPRYGTLWWNSYEGDLKIYYFDGTNAVWVDANNGGTGGGTGGSGGSGITSINGLTDFVQFFNTGYSGSDFNIVSSGSTHTFNLPLAGSAITGLVSPYSQTIYGLKSFNDGVSILNSNQAYFYNSTNDEYVGFKAATGLTSSTTYTLPELDGVSGYALKTDGSGNLYWGVSASGTASIGVTNVLPLLGNNQGDLIWHTEEGTLKIWYEDTDTSQWVDASRNSFGAGSIGSTGIASLNGITESIQTFSVGTAGSTFNISSAGSSHTFNLPIAGNGITGLIDSGTQTIYGAKTFDSDLYAVNNIYVSKDNYIGGVPADFTVGGSTGVIYFGIAKGQNINRFAGMKVEEIASPLGGGNLNGEVVFYTDSEAQDYSTERLRITGFGTVITSGPAVISSSAGSATTSDGALVVHGGIGVSGTVNASSVGIADLTSLFSGYLLTSTTTANQVLHTFDSTIYRTAKYVIQVISGIEVHALEILLTHDGTDVYMTEYAQVLGSTNLILSTFDAQVNMSGMVELLVTPVNASTVYACSCTAIRA